jgi:RHS repeat-associated protein
VAIGEFNLTTDPNGNQITTQDTGTNNVSQYLFDEENRLSCTNKGPQMPSPSCTGSNLIDFIYDHAGVRKIKSAATPTIYPNQFYTDVGGGSGNQFKHIFIGSERILTKKSRIGPDLLHWYYHGDHLHSTAMVTNERSELADALHYFPFGEVWLEERPSSLPADYFFTAKEFDPETGFYDFGARYLDPRFSKWMTADPALGQYLNGKLNSGVYSPSHLALFAYVHHNPLIFLDPTGKNSQLRRNGGGGGSGGSIFVVTVPGYGSQPAYTFPALRLLGRPATSGETERLEQHNWALGIIRNHEPDFKEPPGAYAFVPSRERVDELNAYGRWLQEGGRPGYQAWRTWRNGGVELDATGRPISSPNYSVLFETSVRSGTESESDANHFRQGNRALYDQLMCEPALAARVEAEYPGITNWVTPGQRGGVNDRPFPGLTWHHVPNRLGVIQLVPRSQHQASGPVQQSLHPGGYGGRANWGGGADNR